MMARTLCASCVRARAGIWCSNEYAASAKGIHPAGSVDRAGHRQCGPGGSPAGAGRGGRQCPGRAATQPGASGRRKPPGRASPDARVSRARTQDRTLPARPACADMRAAIPEHGQWQLQAGHGTGARVRRAGLGGSQRPAVAIAMRRARSAQQGFTLIEVLVALALMALLSLISWRALDMVERSGERLPASSDDTLALVRVLGQIESDIGRHAGNDILSSRARWNPAARAGALLPPGIQGHDPVLSLVRSA